MLTRATDGAITAPSSIIHRCPACGWYRALSENVRMRMELIQSPVYGVISVERLALLDVANHDCEKHKVSKTRLGRYLRAVAKQEAQIQTEVERTAA